MGVCFQVYAYAHMAGGQRSTLGCLSTGIPSITSEQAISLNMELVNLARSHKDLSVFSPQYWYYRCTPPSLAFSRGLWRLEQRLKLVQLFKSCSIEKELSFH